MEAIEEKVFPLVPTIGNVIIKGIKHVAKSPGGLILPDSQDKPPERYEIIAIPKGEFCDFQPGQICYLARYQGHRVIIEGEEYIITKDECILAVVRGRKDE